MARKTKEDTEQTYAALIDAAERVFGEKGVARTTLNDIAAAAGMTRGAIYWHFKDKGALIRAMIDRSMLPMEAMLNELSVAAQADPLLTLRHLFVHALTHLAQSPRQQCVMGILFHKCEATDDLQPTLQQDLANRDECLSKVQLILQQAVDQGQLPVDTDVFLSLQIVHNFMIGTMHEWLLDTRRYALDQSAPAMVDMMLAGLRVCPPRIPGASAS